MRTIFAVVAVVLLCVYAPSPGSAADQEKVSAIRNAQCAILGVTLVDEAQDEVSLVIVLNQRVQPKIYSMEAPSRLVVDLPGCTTRGLPAQLAPRSGELVRAVRIGHHADKGFVRFVFDLHDQRRYEAQGRLFVPPGAPDKIRLVITLSGADSTTDAPGTGFSAGRPAQEVTNP